MHILVTGAGGVVGKTIIQKLNKNFKIYGTYRSNKPHIHNSIKLIKSNLKKLTNLPLKCDVIIHCAADSPENLNDMSTLKKNNINSTKLILKYAYLKNVELIIFMSSMSVYGTINKKLVNENTIFNDQNIYGASKEICESLIINWSKNAKKKYIIFRLPGVVGENSSRNFISETYKNIINDKTLKVSNPNSYFNNIIHAETLSKFINKNLKNINIIKNNIFNIASKNPIMMKNIVKLLYKKLNKNQKIQWVDNPSTPFLINYNKIKSFGFKDISVKNSLLKFIKENSKNK